MNPSSDPVLVDDLLSAAVARAPDAIAVVDHDVRLTYAQLDDEVARTTSALRGRRVRRGTGLAASLRSPAQVLIAFLAAMRIGARWVGINPALSEPQQATLVRHSRAAVVLNDGDASWRDAGSTRGAAPRRARSALDPYGPAAIAYTSGTTGMPKGVVHSQHNLTVPARYLSITPDFSESAVIGVCLPVTSLNVIAVSVLPAIASAARCVFVPRADAAHIADWVEREAITTMSIPPPTIFDLATRADLDPTALRSLVAPRTGGAMLSGSIGREYEDRFGRRVMRTYGLSEVPTVVALEPRGEILPERSSGRAVPYLEIKILGDDGLECAPGVAGEICVTTATTGAWQGIWRPMLGYWRRPAATASALRGGVLHTGDDGWVDVAGNLFFGERRSYVINRGGANVYPSDVEDVLRDIPSVADAAVVGIPDRRLGERVAAAVVPTAGQEPDLEAIASICRSKLARYQVPEVLVALQDLPRNAMGKVVKGDVRRSILDRDQPVRMGRFL